MGVNTIDIRIEGEKDTEVPSNTVKIVVVSIPRLVNELTANVNV